MTTPAEFAGRTEYETENLRLRLAPPENLDFFNRAIMAQVTIENKREALAYLDAKRSCVITPQDGALNLLYTDRVLPGGSFVKLGPAVPSWGSATGFVYAWRVTAINEDTLAKDSRRLLLTVSWVDGVKENLDVSYQFVRRSEESTAAR